MTEWTADQARTSILHRQGLLERYPNPIEAMRALTVVQTQYAVSLTPALFARALGVTEDRVNSLLRAERSLVKGWAHRSTVHTMAAEDHRLIMAAVGPFFGVGGPWMKWLDSDHYAAQSEQIMEALKEGPMTRPELYARVELLKGQAHSGWGSDVKGLAYQAKLLIAEQGAARTSFVRADQWIEHQIEAPENALAELCRRYIRGHAPATLRDFRMWTLVSAKSATKALADIRDELDEVTVAGRKGTHYVPKGEEPPTVEIGTPRLLAKFDPLIMATTDRTLFLDPKHTKMVVRAAAQMEATVLLDNKIAAVWRLVRKGTRAEIAVCWFKAPGVRKQKAVEREAEALGTALGFVRTDVVEREI